MATWQNEKVDPEKSFLQKAAEAAIAGNNLGWDIMLGAAIGRGINEKWMNGNGIGGWLGGKKDERAQEASDVVLGRNGKDNNNPYGLPSPVDSALEKLGYGNASQTGQNNNNPYGLLSPLQSALNSLNGNAATNTAANMTTEQQAQAQQEAEQRQKEQLAMNLIIGAATGGFGGGEAAAAGDSLGGLLGGLSPLQDAMEKEAAEDEFSKYMRMYGNGSASPSGSISSFQRGGDSNSGTSPQLEALTSAQRQGLNMLAGYKQTYAALQDVYNTTDDPAKKEEAKRLMDATAKEAQQIRNDYARVGISLDMGGADNTLEQLQGRLNQDTILNLDKLTNGKEFMSSDEYYYKMVDALKKKGFSTNDAKSYAREYAGRYQAELLSRQRGMLRDFGIDNGVLNNVGVELLSRMVEENPQAVATYLPEYASPKDLFGIQAKEQQAAADYARKLDLFGRQNQSKMDLAEYTAQLRDAQNAREYERKKNFEAWKSQYGYGGSSRSGSSKSSNGDGEEKMSKEDAEIMQGIDNALLRIDRLLDESQTPRTQEAHDQLSAELSDLNQMVDQLRGVGGSKAKISEEFYRKALLPRLWAAHQAYNEEFSEFAN